MKRVILSAFLLALAVAGCSSEPMGRDVIAQARPNGQIAFDVVKIDDSVLTTVLRQPRPEFEERFKKYLPPSDLKVAVGDTVSVVIWESGANGLFGTSLTELSLPAGAAAKLLTGQASAPTLRGAPGLPQGMTASPETLASLSGAAGLSSQRLEALVNVAAQSGRAGTRIPDQQVGSDGAISIPYAGRIEVAGHTPIEVQHTIEELLAPKALDPQALVIVSRSAANSVSVAGEAVGGKRVPLSPGGDRLLQVIAAAGGATAPVHETFVRLSRDNVTATVPLAVLVGDPDQDIFAEPGDVLTLVRSPQTFSVFGATGKNATIEFASDHLSLSEALAKAGGLRDDRADPRAVFVFRYEPVSLVRALGEPIATGAPGGLSPIVYRLDLSEAKSYLFAHRFPVHDKDIIFVANSEIRPIYRFFNALSQITGPIQTGLIACYYSQSC